jgi:formaldehyde-activating enzyme involved in methanogenesis
MNFRNRAERAAEAIGGLLGTSPDADQTKAIADAVEKEIIEAVLDESERCVKVAHTCCSPDLDKAHKIAEGIKRTHTALAANLSALR